MSRNKIINKRLRKKCVVCSGKINLILYQDRTYRGGHFFGKMPLYSKKALREANKFGTHPWKMGDSIVQVMNRDPKPHGYAEYWECPRCYWKK